MWNFPGFFKGEAHFWAWVQLVNVGKEAADLTGLALRIGGPFAPSALVRASPQVERYLEGITKGADYLKKHHPGEFDDIINATEKVRKASK